MELKENPKNWRIHPDAQREGLNGSLTEVGWVQSVVYNERTGRVVDGHLRIELAIKNQEESVPVTVVDLSSEEEELILTTFDPISAMAKTNHKALEDLISNITSTSPEIKNLIDRIQKKAKIVTPETQAPSISVAPRRVEIGDVWEVGQHLLICADCTIYTAWDRLLGDARPDICFTSPPYNAGKTAGHKDRNKYRESKDDETEGSYLRLLQDFTTIALNQCDETFVNIGLVAGNKTPVIHYLNSNSDAFKDVIYWVKSSASPHIQDGVINNRVEPIYCFGDGTRVFRHANFSQGTYWNVIEGPGAGSENEYSDYHKATFPVYLPQNIITNFTRNGGSVIDPFMGTGSTLIAAEIEGRKCYGIEIDPVYCDITIARFEKLTGIEAVKREDKRG